MSLWSRLFRWSSPGRPVPSPPKSPDAEAEHPEKTIELPMEPFVFECQSCGKVFEARRKRPSCPECDSPDVSVMSD